MQSKSISAKADCANQKFKPSYCGDPLMAQEDKNPQWLPQHSEVEVVGDFDMDGVPTDVLLEMFQNQIDVARESLCPPNPKI